MRLPAPPVLMLSVVVGLGPLSPMAPVAAAVPADTVATTTAVSAPASREGSTTRVLTRVRRVGGDPVAGVSVLLERRRSGTWRQLARARTAADGTVAAPMVLARRASENVVRATYAGGDAVPGAGGEPTAATYGGSTSGPAPVELVRRTSTITLGGPEGVRDGQRVTLRLRWAAGSGAPVSGPARVQQRTRSGWRLVARVPLGAEGGRRRGSSR